MCACALSVSKLGGENGTRVSNRATEHELTRVLVNGAGAAKAHGEAICPGSEAHFVLLSHSLTKSVVGSGSAAIEQVVLSGGTFFELEDHVGVRDARKATGNCETSGVCQESKNYIKKVRKSKKEGRRDVRD